MPPVGVSDVPRVLLAGVELPGVVQVQVDMEQATVDATTFGGPVRRLAAGPTTTRVLLVGMGIQQPELPFTNIPLALEIQYAERVTYRGTALVTSFRQDFDSMGVSRWEASLLMTGPVERVDATLAAWDVERPGPGRKEEVVGRRVDLSDGPPRVVIGPEFSIVMVHFLPQGCGGIALYRMPGRMVVSAEARYPDGTRPGYATEMRCGNCGAKVAVQQLRSFPREDIVAPLASLLQDPDMQVWSVDSPVPGGLGKLYDDGFDPVRIERQGEGRLVLVQDGEQVERKVDL